MMMRARLFISVLILGSVSVLAGACAQQPPSPPPLPPVIYSAPELKYLLISNFGDVFYVDRDFYPVAREGQEEKNALEQFPAIRSNDAEFSAILDHLSLPNKGEYTAEEQLGIYREHKKLKYAVEMSITSS